MDNTKFLLLSDLNQYFLAFRWNIVLLGYIYNLEIFPKNLKYGIATAFLSVILVPYDIQCKHSLATCLFSLF